MPSTTSATRTAAILIRSARKQADLTQAELARRIGTKQPVISRWESAAEEPRLSALARVVSACGLRLKLSLVPDEVDRSQIRQQLAMSPSQRLESVANLSRLRATARRIG